MSLAGVLIGLNALFALCYSRHHLDFVGTPKEWLNKTDNSVAHFLRAVSSTSATSIADYGATIFSRICIFMLSLLFIKRLLFKPDPLIDNYLIIYGIYCGFAWISIAFFTRPASYAIGPLREFCYRGLVVFALPILDLLQTPQGSLTHSLFNLVFMPLSRIGIDIEFHGTLLAAAMIYATFTALAVLYFLVLAGLLSPFFLTGLGIAWVVQQSSSLLIKYNPRPISIICAILFALSAVWLALLS